MLIYERRAFSVYTIVFLVNSVVNTILSRFYVVGLYWEFREGPSRTYNWQALCTASILAELPGSFVCTVLYFVLWYFPSGLPLGGTAAYIFLMAFTYGIFQASTPPQDTILICPLELSDTASVSSRSLHDGFEPGSRRSRKHPRFHHLHAELVQRLDCSLQSDPSLLALLGTYI